MKTSKFLVATVLMLGAVGSSFAAGETLKAVNEKEIQAMSMMAVSSNRPVVVDVFSQPGSTGGGGFLGDYADMAGGNKNMFDGPGSTGGGGFLGDYDDMFEDFGPFLMIVN